LLAQVKLLRFLQEKEYRPIGSAKARSANVRIVAASNSDLRAATESGALRRDLFYRLNIMHLHLPPLRERKQDIILLANHFLEKYRREFGRPSLTAFEEPSIQALLTYGWPGNIRELEHVIARAVALCEQDLISETELGLPQDSHGSALDALRIEKARVVAEFETKYLRQVLQVANGNITRAAALANKNRRAFWQLLKKYGIAAGEFTEAKVAS
jgi:two-component system response regulator GlrR